MGSGNPTVGAAKAIGSTRRVAQVMSGAPRARGTRGLLRGSGSLDSVLVVLNRPLTSISSRLWRQGETSILREKDARTDATMLTLKLWTSYSAAKLRVLADGAANRIHDDPEILSPGSSSKEEARGMALPDVIIGDLDSIRDEVKEYYLSKEVRVVDMSHDQDSTDLVKSLEFVKEEMRKRGYDALGYAVIVIGAFGGRLDHILSHLQVLYLYRDMDLILVDEDSVAMIMDRGKTLIEIDESCEGPTCGLIPLGMGTRVDTTGLVWNLKKETHRLMFGKLISTCNKLAKNVVTVDAEDPIIWTMELRCDMLDQ